MSESDPPSREPEFAVPAIRWSKLKLPFVLLAAGIAGALVSRWVVPVSRPIAQRAAKPIVEIVRPQPTFPDLSDLIGRLCPSVATIVPAGSTPSADSNESSMPAFAISSDGWLVTAGALPATDLDAVFGDGRRASVGEVRSDPVSGLAIVKINLTGLPSLPVDDQGFPRVGQFGFSLGTLSGNGCTAGAAMIDSDFLADGGAPLSYVRIGPQPDDWAGGMPFIGPDGRVIGVAISNPDSSIIPGPLAAIVIDELIRNSPSASTKFGFRAIDFAAPLSSRLGDVRSGAGIAFVQRKSPAATAGLKAGDIAIAVDDQPVSSASELNRALDVVSASSATLSIVRGAQQLKLKIKRV